MTARSERAVRRANPGAAADRRGTVGSVTASGSFPTATTYYIAGNGVTSSTSVSEGQGFSSGWNSSIEYQEKHNVTGDVRVNMIGNRTPYIDATQWWGHELSESTGTASADWTSYSNYGCSQLLVCNGWIQRGAPLSYKQMSIGGSITAVSGFDMSVSFGFSAPVGDGITVGPSIGFDIVSTSSATASGSQQVLIDFQVSSNAPYAWYEFDVLCEGGSSSNVGLVAHIWQIGQSNTAPS